MKRIPVHATFALAAVAALAAVVVQGVRLQRTQAFNAAIAAASREGALTAAASAAPAASTASVPASDAAIDPTTASDAARDAPREVRLAQATALSQAGAFDAAFKAFSGLIEPGHPDAIGQQALYNLGNMYLRQGLGLGTTPGSATNASPRSPAEAGPLVELAKQRYRDLLRAEPGDWDARYNLERALRAAPEEQEAVPEDSNTPVERRNVMLRGLKAGDLP